MALNGRVRLYWAAGTLSACIAFTSLAGSAFAATEEPIRGGTLTALWTSEVNTLDPIFTNSPGGHSSTFNLYAENLVDIMPSGELRPVLATSWNGATIGNPSPSSFGPG
jgi:ABC-type transport system substrate-binding protein